MTNKYHITTNMGIKMATPSPLQHHKQWTTTTILSEADDGHPTHNYNEDSRCSEYWSTMGFHF